MKTRIQLFTLSFA